MPAVKNARVSLAATLFWACHSCGFRVADPTPRGGSSFDVPAGFAGGLIGTDPVNEAIDALEGAIVDLINRAECPRCGVKHRDAAQAFALEEDPLARPR